MSSGAISSSPTTHISFLELPAPVSVPVPGPAPLSRTGSGSSSSGSSGGDLSPIPSGSPSHSPPQGTGPRIKGFPILRAPSPSSPSPSSSGGSSPRDESGEAAASSSSSSSGSGSPVLGPRASGAGWMGRKFKELAKDPVHLHMRRASSERILSCCIKKCATDRRLREACLNLLFEVTAIKPVAYMKHCVELLPKTSNHMHRCGNVSGTWTLEQAGKVEGLWMDIATLECQKKLPTDPVPPTHVKVADLVAPGLHKHHCYSRFEETTTMRHWKKKVKLETSRSPLAHFHRIFRITWSIHQHLDPAALILENISNAIRDNVSVFELMVDLSLKEDVEKLMDEEYSKIFAASSPNYEAALKHLESNSWLEHYVTSYKAKIESWEKSVNESLKTQGKLDKKPYFFIIGEIQRTEFTNAEFFALVAGLVYLTRRCELVVGLNCVGDETHPFYKKNRAVQFNILKWVNEFLKFNNIIGHIGEMTEHEEPDGNSRKDAISQAIDAGIRRMGHCVTLCELPSEKFRNTIKKMEDLDVSVEICWTSNKLLLGTSKKNHPGTLLKRTKVRHSICGDDSALFGETMIDVYAKTIVAFQYNYTDVKARLCDGIEMLCCPEPKKALIRDKMAKDLDEYEKKILSEVFNHPETWFRQFPEIKPLFLHKLTEGFGEWEKASPPT